MNKKNKLASLVLYKLRRIDLENRVHEYAMENDTASGVVTEYAISIDSLEQYLGYDFFKELDSSVMKLIEAEASVDAWVIKGD